ncbi:MAG: ATP-grasp domain-containing protein [Patescibacteria group bacterium]
MKILIVSLIKKNNQPVESLIAAGQSKNHQIDHCSYRDLKLIFNNQDGFQILVPDLPLSTYDCLILRRPVNLTHISHLLAIYAKKHNIYLLNQDSIIDYPLFDKAIQYALLAEKSIPIIPATLDTVKNDFRYISQTFGLPFIYKCINGTCGLTVYKINNSSDLENLPRYQKRAKHRLYLAQKYWPIDYDLRIITLGKKVLGGMKRISINPQEFRTNYSLGNQVENYSVPPEIADLALRASSAVKCEHAGIDILFHQGQPYIIEINRYCYFDGFKKATSIDVAAEIIDYLQQKIQK